MPATKKSVKNQKKQFTIDCEVATEEGIIDLAAFEKFLQDRIKVNGKTGGLQGVVDLTRTASAITVTTEAPFPKRYLKYLTKKFLKKMQLRDAFRVVAVNASTYKLSWFNISDEAEEEEADE
ncbi:uncharacterized protein MONBRDRAFT_34459 [Monosiga brevicollis MX1]|uniref:Large ribosomal subunit protein eL22 n=1 Tax=Monosiga brevicollis TaxID=81824 RepID=A9VBW2_MONBE|nr:uncharacterized protein MONBRDRAFT_34459 [Monosiga brevicollis MX1]EDQ85002.1 predicted protein [Monosiga brevicollis MX1]|eukprot:XP_001750172.1 hypothetical protein [Monosiga brevicollis MX1]